MTPLLTETNATKRSAAYSELFGSALRQYDGYTIRNDRYKLIHLQNNTEYLYNLTTDPFEKTNLMLTTLSAEAAQNLTQLRATKAGL